MKKLKQYIFLTSVCILFSLQSNILAQGEISDITNKLNGTISDRYSTTGNEGIAKLTDNNTYSKYLTTNSSTWVRFTAADSAVVTKYTITSANDAQGRDPKNWIFQASANGVNWVNLDAQTNQTFINRFQKKTYTFVNQNTYKYFQLNISANSGEPYTQIAELEIFGTGGGINDTVKPAAPTAIKALSVSDNQIIVTWTDNALNETKLTLEKSPDGTTWGQSITLPANTNKYYDLNLTALTKYYYRVKTENANGSSAYSSIVNAATLKSDYPATIQEDWDVHTALITNVFNNPDVGVYFDSDMLKTYSNKPLWFGTYFTKVWRYVKENYGTYSDPKLFVVIHQNKYGGGHPATIFDAGHHYRNVIDIGSNNNWVDSTGWNLVATTHEVAHIVEGATNNYKKSVAFPLWGDSKWAEIFVYDVFGAVGKYSERTSVYNEWMASNHTDTYPVANTHWFRDWFEPIYRLYGGKKTLANFFNVLAKNFPIYNQEYARDINYGEFVFFWSAAANFDLKPLATKAFGWPAAWEAQYQQAKLDFPDVTFGTNSVDEKTAAANPFNFELQQNYPNPFNPATTITYSIPEEGLVTLKVYNVLGQEIASLVNEVKQPATYMAYFDAGKLSSGIYIYKLSAKNFTASKKMVLT